MGHISFEVDGAGYPTQVYRIGLDAELIDVGARTLGYGDRRQYSQPAMIPANEPVELTTALRALLIISLSGIIDVSRFFFRCGFRRLCCLDVRMVPSWYGVDIWTCCPVPKHVHLAAGPGTLESYSYSLAIGEAHRRYSRLIHFRHG